ncbi:MAG: MEDS domain-containing protein [Thermodesulfobacteriota bacterium]
MSSHERKRRKISLGFSGEKVDEGYHIIYLYNDDLERKKVMAKFLQQGFLDREKVLYLVDDISPDEMKKELLSLGVDVDTRQKDFDISEGHYTRCPGNYFSPEFMLNIVGSYYKEAIQEGYSGARGAGEMSWALVEGRTTVPELLDYESKLNRILYDYPLTTVCQYDARRFDGAIIMDMLSVHPMMIVRGQLVRNPSYVEPEIFLKEYRERIDRNTPA